MNRTKRLPEGPHVNPLLADNPADTLANVNDVLKFIHWATPTDAQDVFEGASSNGFRLLLQAIENAVEFEQTRITRMKRPSTA